VNDKRTLYQVLVAALRQAAEYNRADTTAPAAVIWTDAARQWESLLPRLRTELPLLTLGPYDPAARSGPAIWLRCMIARTLPEADWPEEATPILYLPGISRQDLRAVDECPRDLQPLAELQYRGALWTHRNGRDWTIGGFLQGHDDLLIEVATDAATREALQRSLAKLADEPVASLRGEAPLTALKLNALLNPEPVRNLLVWMNAPAAQKALQTDAEWGAFRDTCRHQFGFDPTADGEVSAALLLGGRDGAWQSVWNRFAEAPQRYPNLPDLLRRARPVTPDALFHDPSSWPQDNEAQERALRARLIALKDVLPADVRKQVWELEKTHGERRDWVWAALGFSPLARVLPTLVTLADVTANPLGGMTPDDVADAYVAGGWRADAAVLEGLTVPGNTDDVNAVKGVIDVLYRPWLNDSAEAFQQAVRSHPLPLPEPGGSASAAKAGCSWLFADGLRYDVGQGVADALEQQGFSVERGRQWAALPGVTPTAKPAVSPVAPLLGPGSGFNCVVREDGAKVAVDNLRRELAKAGYAILMKDDVGSPGGSAWTECGALDITGHNLGWKLALRIPDEVAEIASRVRALLEAGWLEVRVVTDHGWLLLPSGLPKADLPEHLTEERKGRCARLKATANTSQQTVPWRWDKDVRIAVPPGICCYKAGQEYDHGGLSPQECITPVLVVRKLVTTPAASLSAVRWTGLRCRIQVTGGDSSLTVDVRKKPADAATSIAASPKKLDTGGQAALVVPDDSIAGEAAVVVLLGPDGGIIAQQATVVGEEG
jgi:hypothetical protein